MIVDFTRKGTGTRIRNNVPMKGSHVFRVVIQEPRMGFGKKTRIKCANVEMNSCVNGPINPKILSTLRGWG